MYKELIKNIEEYETIIIHRHSRPDGDALGSQIGLREVLKTTYSKKRIFAVGDLNSKYNFIGDMDIIDKSEYEKALVLVLDTSDKALISGEEFSLGDKIIRIDHHITKESFGDLEFVNTSFESCAGLITNIVLNSNLKLSDIAARALFTGIVTDSGRFRYDSTNSRTLLLSSKLLEYNFSISEIYNNLYIDDLNLVKLRAQFILNFKLTENNVAYLKNTKEDLEKYNVDFFTISRGMVNTMAGIKGIDIWVNFTEDVVNNCVIAEIRSSKYNINPIAVKYGGGGHKAASGASLKSFEEADLMLQDLDNLLKENS